MLVDTHAHLNFPAFDKDRKEVIKRCLDDNIFLINVGTNYETSKRAVEIAEKYPQGVYASIGLHPINLDTSLVKIKEDALEGSHFEREFGYERYKKLARLRRGSGGPVVAIGEIGLDYYWKPKTKRKLELFKEKQKGLCLKELELARELNLPVIFHCRMAHNDLISILTDTDIFDDRQKHQQAWGVVHSFVGTLEQLKKYLDMGLYIGYNGIIFKEIEGVNFGEIIKNTPLEKILIETDCPYLTPLPAVAKGAKVGPHNDRNEPIFVKYIAQEIAKIKDIAFEKVAEITTQNAKNLFKI